MKNKKILALLLTVALMVSMLPSMAFAGSIETHKFVLVLGTKAFDQVALAKPENRAEIKQALIANGNKFYWVKGNGTIVDNGGKVADPAVLPKDITLKKGDGTTEIINENGGQPGEALEVISIAVVNSTTVTVNFSKAPERPLGMADFEKLGVSGAEVTSVSQGVKPEVYTLTVKELVGQGTVKVAGKSATYSFASVEEKTGIKSVELNDYRKITVDFVGEVDRESIKPENFYLELVSGTVGEKLGAQAKLDKDYQLKQIVGNDGVAAVPTLIHYKDGKRLTNPDVPFAVEPKADRVEILFDEKARVGNTVTGKVSEDVLVQILDMGKVGSEDKLLGENVKVAFSARNLTRDKKRVLDTSVNEILIMDKKNPEVVMILDKDKDKVSDAGKELFQVNAIPGQKLHIYFNEPMGVAEEAVGSQDLLPFGLPAYADVASDTGQISVNNKKITVDKNEIAVNGMGYDLSKVITIDLDKLQTKVGGAPFGVGKTAKISITGLRDIAGNLAPVLDLNIKFVLPQHSAVTPEIQGVAQVKDNVFAVFANLENVTGILNIKGADKGGKDVRTLIPYTSIAVDADKSPFGKAGYYSLVEVEVKGNSDDDALSYRLASKKNFDIAVEMPAYIPTDKGTNLLKKMVPAAARMEGWAQSGFLVQLDVLGPKYNVEKKETDKANGKLLIPVGDVVPDEYFLAGKYPVNPNHEDKSTQNEQGDNAPAEFVGNGKLQVSYDDNGTLVSKVADLEFGATAAYNNSALAKLKVTTNNADPVYLENGNLVFNLPALKVKGLPGEFLTGVGDALIEGATYKLLVPEGLVTDEYYLPAGTNLAGANDPAANLTDYENAYNNTAAGLAETAITLSQKSIHAARTEKKGITSGELRIEFEVEDTKSTGVPQTSLRPDAVKYENKELVIFFTGNPTEESLLNLDNYSLNGQTLKSLGAESLDVSISKGTAGTDQIGTTDASYVVRIKLPKNSIKTDGPASVTIENIAHMDGAKMAKVFIKAVEGFEDNTSPELVEAKFTKLGKITLSFDEALKLSDGVNVDSAKRNFKVEFSGAVLNITSMSVSDNVIQLQVETQELPENAELKVTIQKNTENNMEIEDANGNKLDPSYGKNANVKPVL